MKYQIWFLCLILGKKHNTNTPPCKAMVYTHSHQWHVYITNNFSHCENQLTAPIKMLITDMLNLVNHSKALALHLLWLASFYFSHSTGATTVTKGERRFNSHHSGCSNLFHSLKTEVIFIDVPVIGLLLFNRAT